MGNINSEWLRGINPGLIHEDDGINDQLQKVHFGIVRAVQNYQSALDEANKVSEEYKPDVRRSRQSKIIAEAFNKLMSEVSTASQPIIAREKTAHLDMMNAARPAPEDSVHKELLQLLKHQEVRKLLRQMPVEKRSDLLQDSAARGDNSILHAIETAPDALVPQQTIDLARDCYLKTAKPDAVAKYGQAKSHAEAINNALSVLPQAAARLAKQKGHDLAQALRQYQADTIKATGKNLSDEDKIKYVAEHGFEGYVKMRSGMEPAPADDKKGE